MLGFVGPAVGAVSNVNRAVSLLKSLSDVSQEGELLWHALDAIDGPLACAVALQRRHETLHIFDGAIRLTQRTIEDCEAVLARDEGEDGRPSSQDGWLQWLSHKKKGISRREALPKLSSRLMHCTGALQLAFAASSALQPMPVPSPPLSSNVPGHSLKRPFEVLEEALHTARAIVHEFEMGRRQRLLCSCGAFHSCTDTANSSTIDGRNADGEGGDWREEKPRSVWVEMDDTGAYRVCFQPAIGVGASLVDDDSEDGDGCGENRREIQLAFSSGVCAKRYWSGDVPTLRCFDPRTPFGRHQIVYVFATASGEPAQYAIVFDVPPPSVSRDNQEYLGHHRSISAEVFEAILAMLVLKHLGTDEAHPLDVVCDLDTEVGIHRFEDSLRQLGEYRVTADEGSVTALTSELARATIRTSARSSNLHSSRT